MPLNPFDLVPAQELAHLVLRSGLPACRVVAGSAHFGLRKSPARTPLGTRPLSEHRPNSPSPIGRPPSAHSAPTLLLSGRSPAIARPGPRLEKLCGQLLRHGVINTARPNMTPGGAAVLAAMGRYALAGYGLTLLEVQKLVYFLQEAGEDLKLPFVKASYGPYADTLRHVLSRMDGHFIRGWGDGANKPATPLEVAPEAADEAEALLRATLPTHDRLQRVADLIEGFETPYGMELLISVHWVATREDPAARTDAATAASAVSSWNHRKRRIFQPEHIELAWGRLKEREWI